MLGFSLLAAAAKPLQPQQQQQELQPQPQLSLRSAHKGTQVRLAPVTLSCRA